MLMRVVEQPHAEYVFEGSLTCADTMDEFAPRAPYPRLAIQQGKAAKRAWDVASQQFSKRRERIAPVGALVEEFIVRQGAQQPR